MKGEINWLKNHWSAGCLVLLMTFIALHINSNSCCLAKGNDTCLQLFLPCFLLARYLRVTCKHHDVLQDVRSQENKSEALVMSEIGGGHSLNQEVGLSRSIHTWWSSHYRTIMHIISMYPTPWSPNKYKKWFVTEGMSRNMCTLLAILAYANELSQDLERVINIYIRTAMSLVKLTESRLQYMRSCGCEQFLANVTLFGNKYGTGFLHWFIIFSLVEDHNGTIQYKQMMIILEDNYILASLIRLHNILKIG